MGCIGIRTSRLRHQQSLQYVLGRYQARSNTAASSTQNREVNPVQGSVQTLAKYAEFVSTVLPFRTSSLEVNQRESPRRDTSLSSGYMTHPMIRHPAVRILGRVLLLGSGRGEVEKDVMESFLRAERLGLTAAAR